MLLGNLLEMTIFERFFLETFLECSPSNTVSKIEVKKDNHRAH